jgi:hypothetical protein
MDSGAAIEPTALLGDWQLARTLADQRTGQSGTVRGRLTLRGERDQITWHEQGRTRRSRSSPGYPGNPSVRTGRLLAASVVSRRRP